MKIKILLILVFFSLSLFSQKELGQWNDYLSYHSTRIITEGENKMYAANKSTIFSLDLTDNSIERFSSVNGLSDKGISSMKWNSTNKVLVVGYQNGNVDFVTDNEVINFSDIKRSSIISDKAILNIFNEGEFAWLSCGFGIVKVNISQREVVETYIIGPAGTEMRINEVLLLNGKVYAASAIGLLEADLNDPLQDFGNWSFVPGAPLGNYGGVFEFGGKPCAFYNETQDSLRMWRLNEEENTWEQFPYGYGNFPVKDFAVGEGLIAVLHPGFILIRTVEDATFETVADYQFSDKENMETIFFDSQDQLWIGDLIHGLVLYNGADFFTKTQPGSPSTDVTWAVDSRDDKLWITHGAVDNTFTSLFLNDYFSGLNNLDWEIYARNADLSVDSVSDIVDVAINPNNPDQVYFASWKGGLVEKKPDGTLEIYNGLLGFPAIQSSADDDSIYRIGGLDFDREGNLWMTNSSPEEQLVVRKATGEWLNFGCNDITTSNKITELVVTSNNQVWFLNKQAGDGGLMVYDYKGTLDNANDDQCKKINTNENNGGVPTNNILSVAEDLDGEIWIGTTEGPAVIYSPEFLFDSDPPVAQQIKIEQDGNVEIVLATASITAIAIDGANRKWLGTSSSGAFLLSEDGTETILHFTAENSPLLSNDIKNITIDDRTGEVFFGTTDGLISYINDANLGNNDNTCFNVFPNPVRPEYSGPIAIEGLVRDSNVKITDIAGNIVFETTSLGGRSIWNGTNFSGERVQSGVYLALITSIENDIESSCVAKILFIN